MSKSKKTESDFGIDVTKAIKGAKSKPPKDPVADVEIDADGILIGVPQVTVTDLAPVTDLPPNFLTTIEHPDLDRCLATPMPGPEATTEEQIRTLVDWHQTVMAVGKKTAAVVWRIGKLLQQLRAANAGHWEKFVKENLAPIGLSKSTCQRYIEVAKQFIDVRYLRTKTITEAYEDAGVYVHGKSNVDKICDQLEKLAIEVTRISHRLVRLTDEREYNFEHLNEDDYEERDEMWRIFKADLKLNASLQRLKNSLGTEDSIPIAPQSLFYRKCKLLKEWIGEFGVLLNLATDIRSTEGMNLSDLVPYRLLSESQDALVKTIVERADLDNEERARVRQNAINVQRRNQMARIQGKSEPGW